jgi:transcriptional regulator with XRE-family HTH domain
VVLRVEQNLTRVGLRLKQARLCRQLSLEALAEKSGTLPSTLAGLEDSDIAAFERLDFLNLCRIAEVVGLQLNELFSESELERQEPVMRRFSL